MGSFTSKSKPEYFNYYDIEEMLNFNWKIVIYKDRIYDISHITEHPAGMELIEKNIGKDITKHIQFHSKEAKKQLKQNFIGYLIKN